MKTYPLVLDDTIHTAIKHSAKISGESIKGFIMKAIKARLNIEDYIKTNKELQNDLKNWDTIDFIEIKSIKELFK